MIIHGKGTGLQGAWNHQWKVFFDTNKLPSRDQIMTHLSKMYEDFGIIHVVKKTP